MRVVSWLCLIISLSVSIFFFQKISKDRFTFYGDALGYYCYLPSVFIYHNLDHFETTPKNSGVPDRIVNSIRDMGTPNALTPKGYYLNQYTCGVAIMELPFFLLAHGYEKYHHLPMNGYSSNYENALRYGGIFYTAIGLFFIFLLIKRSFNADIARIIISIVLLGTNLFWFTWVQVGMVHVPIFMLYAIVIYYTINFYEKPRWWHAVVLGLAAGLIVVMRPSDLILLMVIPLYGLKNRSDLKQRWQWIIQYKYLWIVMACFALLPILPQLILWKQYTGQFIYDSYKNQTFQWSFQNTGKGLWGSNNGWLFYSPIMIFSILGFFFIKKLEKLNWSLWIVVPIYIFVIYSWWCYTYINGFGSRPMIHLYPLLAFPFAALIQWLQQKSNAFFTLFLLVTAFCCYANLAWSRHQILDYITTEQTHRYHAWNMLFKTETSYEDIVRADAGRQPNYTKQKVVKTLVTNPCEDSSVRFYTTDERDSTNHFIKIPAGEEWPPVQLCWLYDEYIAEPKQWIRVSGKFLSKMGWVDTYTSQDFRCEIAHRGVWVNCRIPNKIGREHTKGIPLHSAVKDQWGEVFFYARIPSSIQNRDSIKVLIHNNAKEELWIDDLKMELTE
ncbi:MAG: glycosyltransferase family 39 protein [Chitinophagaceae bacterium]|nr:glycosyltransferase family 39 protein [Chitinophagaceae bacterium]